MSHDDIVLSVNWETASDRRNTQLNCAVTADADSGFVYRLDIDFDPNVAPLDLFNEVYLDEEALAELVFKATLQPASTFMNSLRVRLSAAERAGGGGARVGGSYIPGAVFNPRVLISLLNIFRVHYNFFELRPYATPYEDISTALQTPVKKVPRALRIPGTDEWIDLAPKASKTQERKTPAMRHGLNAHTRRKTGEIAVPDLHRLIYRPWLYAGTKVGAKLDRTWQRTDITKSLRKG